MAGHGELVNARRYWTWTGPDGKTQSGSTPPATGTTGVFGTGINAKPNPPATEYEERTYKDGTKILSRFDPEKTEWVQESIEVDEGLRGQSKDEAAAAAAAAKAADKAPDRQTFPDGSLRERDPTTGEWTILATKPQGPVQNAAPELHTFPDGSQAQWNPATSKWDVVATKPPAKDDLPEVTVPARRPGQTTDLATVKSEADTYLANLNAQVASGALTRAQRASLWDAYYEKTVKPRLEAANAEANAEAARAAERQAEADRRGRAGEDRATRLAELQFGQRAGQDAVKNAMDLLHYQVSPTFLREFAAGLGTLSSGGGHVQFSPEAFQINLPDVDALATQGAQRAAALYHANTVPFTPAGAGGGAGPGPIASSSAVTQQLNALPMAAQTAAAAPAPAAVPASAGPSATPGIGAGAPSPLPPDWPWTSPTPANY